MTYKEFKKLSKKKQQQILDHDYKVWKMRLLDFFILDKHRAFGAPVLVPGVFEAYGV